MSQFINGITNSILPVNTYDKPISPGKAHANFADNLKSAIENVNKTQVISNQKTEAFARGEIENLHDVMIASQKSSVTLEASVQVQRKVIDAYNEIMRMQV
ncbi:flagellar hook-basal body complex protein FliE [Virgibacillus necropolis]|uniref:Flagellar hook-basal body complex protein FliE n=1 Tax=Virgibacillus necropolis TaxID=163877 RepID=A0A221MDP8_9BACI|nr:flagellar hook-basal body complex protein FliE [Virgibacillus necropolis]ASN05730.1 flagellar hook-basal body complex protein FliE [Virgibacillus necropolis]